MAAYTTIDDPELYFQTKLYTGNGSTQSITLDGDEDMQPDLVWIKSRNDTNPHTVVDSVRGATKVHWTNVRSAEGTFTDEVTSFDSDGFSLGASSNAYTNENTITHVAWCWKAGTSFTNDASATSVGNTDSNGSASSTAGFSISKYVGVGSSLDIQVKHGLSVKPAVMITKIQKKEVLEIIGLYIIIKILQRQKQIFKVK